MRVSGAALGRPEPERIPAPLSIYGKNVRDTTDASIPEDVAEKSCACRAGLTVATLREKAIFQKRHLMGITGSIVDRSFWENYLGIRVQALDMTEVRRRMDKHYDWRIDLAMRGPRLRL